MDIRSTLFGTIVAHRLTGFINVYGNRLLCTIADAGWDGGRRASITAGAGGLAWFHAGAVQDVSAGPLFERRVR